jgi:hypothetical protein
VTPSNVVQRQFGYFLPCVLRFSEGAVRHKNHLSCKCPFKNVFQPVSISWGCPLWFREMPAVSLLSDFYNETWLIKFQKKIGRIFYKQGWKMRSDQFCQMVYFQTKNTNLGKFCKVLQCKMLVFLWPFGTFYGRMVYVWAVWFILWSLCMYIYFPVLVYILYQEKPRDAPRRQLSRAPLLHRRKLMSWRLCASWRLLCA